MVIRVEKFSGGELIRKVLIGMITSDSMLGRLQWDSHAFGRGSRWANLIGEWCVEYFQEYSKAPRKAIEGLFQSWAGEHVTQPKLVESVESFLSSLNGEYERRKEDLEPDYLLNLASKVFNKARAEDTIEEAKGHLTAGKLNRAIGTLTSYSKLETGMDSSFDVFLDSGKHRDVFQRPPEPLIQYEGPLQTFFCNAIERDSFLAFVAPEKTGKSYMLLDVAFRAMCQRKRVMFFEAGDMSQRQVLTRFLVRTAEHPLRSPDGNWPVKVRVPESIRPPEWEKDEDGDAVLADAPVIKFAPENLVFRQPLTESICKERVDHLMKTVIKTKHNSYLKMSVHPNSTLTTNMIRAELDRLIRNDWRPDIVVIDYMDILAPLHNKMEPREQINVNWKQVRRISQEYHCLVVTATQSNALAYSQRGPMSRRNFSEDKRKWAHATAVAGLQVNQAEKRLGAMRLNWVFGRDIAAGNDSYCYVAGCLALANPCMVSHFSRPGERLPVSEVLKNGQKNDTPSRNGHGK